jgi:hypothetical protein
MCESPQQCLPERRLSCVRCVAYLGAGLVGWAVAVVGVFTGDQAAIFTGVAVVTVAAVLLVPSLEGGDDRWSKSIEDGSRAPSPTHGAAGTFSRRTRLRAVDPAQLARPASTAPRGLSTARQAGRRGDGGRRAGVRPPLRLVRAPEESGSGLRAGESGVDPA